MALVYNITDYGGTINSSSVATMNANVAAFNTIWNLIRQGGSGGYITWNDDLYVNSPVSIPNPWGTGVAPSNPINYGIIGNGLSTFLQVAHSGIGIDIDARYTYDSVPPLVNAKQIIRGLSIKAFNTTPSCAMRIQGVGENVFFKDIQLLWHGTGLHIKNCDGLTLNNAFTSWNTMLGGFYENANNIECVRVQHRNSATSTAIPSGDGAHFKNCQNIYGYIELESNGYWGGIASGMLYSDISYWFEHNRDGVDISRGGNRGDNSDGAQLPHFRARDSFYNRMYGQVHQERNLTLDADPISKYGHYISSYPSGYKYLGDIVGSGGLTPLGNMQGQNESLIYFSDAKISASTGPQTYFRLEPGYTSVTRDVNSRMKGDWYQIPFPNPYSALVTNFPRYSGDYYSLSFNMSGSPATINWLQGIVGSGYSSTLTKTYGLNGVVPSLTNFWQHAHVPHNYLSFEQIPFTAGAFPLDGGASGDGSSSNIPYFHPMFNISNPLVPLPSNTIPLEFWMYNLQIRMIRNGRPSETATIGGLSLNYNFDGYGTPPYVSPDIGFIAYTSEGQSVVITASVKGLFQTVMRGYLGNIGQSGVTQFDFRYQKQTTPVASSSYKTPIVSAPNIITNIQ